LARAGSACSPINPSPLIARSQIADIFCPIYVRNEFFGGNVDVTGLLTAQDIVNAIIEFNRERAQGEVGQATSAIASNSGSAPVHRRPLYLVPRVIFNDDGLTLDDATLEDMEKAAGRKLHVVSCSPLQYFPEITELLNATE
jgi:hypothetical protein